MSAVRVELGARAYDVRIETGLVAQLDVLAASAGCANASAFVLVADRRVGAVVRVAARALARLGAPVHEIVLDVEERLKSPAGLDALYDRLIAGGVDRRGVVVAIGGGVIGDLAGFCAATYVRGIRWIGVPTTLLAAVDSAIGGKTGINHARGKNLIGAIHQPALVVVDPASFATLPKRERISGYGEMLKYGLALDRELWEALLACGPDAIPETAIERCVALKAAVVARDERDETGVREVLNFGHTIGHAIEAATDYGRYRHGEAVILGMRAAVRLSTLRGRLARGEGGAIDAALARVPLPAPAPFDVDAIVAAARRDKKQTAAGTPRFVLLRAIGETVSDDGVDEATMRAALEVLAHQAVLTP